MRAGRTGMLAALWLLAATSCAGTDRHAGHDHEADEAMAAEGAEIAAHPGMGTAPAAVGAHQHGAAVAADGAVHPGTAAMAARLAAMNASLSVEDDVWGSEHRLRELLASPVPEQPEQRLQRQINIAVNQLNAGLPEEAAANFAELRTTLLSLPGDAEARVATELQSLLAVSWLRWGELQNCATNHNADSCLLPLRDGGIHQDARGADRAVAELEDYLQANPEALRERWLLNIAHMARGTWPAGVPAQQLIPPEAFASDEPFERFTDVAPELGLDVADQAGGIIVDDFSGDGNLDLMVSSIGNYDQLRYFQSRGDGSYEERTSSAGLSGLLGGLNLIQADYDGDGWLDVLVLRGGWTDISRPYPNSLVRNRGDGTFEDVTEAAGLLSFHPTQTAAWADFDNDGDLDLFIGNESAPLGRLHPNELFRNQGDGTFTNVAAAAGVNSPGFSKGAVWGDYDNDGRVDLFVSRHGQPNFLYHNDGPDAAGAWHFHDVAVEAGVTEPAYSFPAVWWDYDNDGWLDLFVSGYGGLGAEAAAEVAADYLDLPTQGDRPRLFHNQRDGTFEDRAAAAGVDALLYTMGMNVGDLDNDGHEDLYCGTGNPDYRSVVPNRMFRNVGDGTFHDVTTAGGFGNLQKGHGVSFADLDNDGDQDVYEDMGGAYDGDWYPNVLYENPGHGRHWATLRLKGPGANPAGIGARLRVRLSTPSGPRSLYRLVGSGGSFGANSLQVELGLADATAIDEIGVTWPGAPAEETFSGAGLDGIWQLAAGSGRAVKVTQAAFVLGGEAPVAH